MPIVCGIRFRGTGKVYYFDPGEALQDLEVGDHVIVETARGAELGEVAFPCQEVEEGEVVGELKPVLRRATTADLLDAQLYQAKEGEACETCREQVAKFKLPMKVVSAEYSFDGSRLTFFFTAEQRVDFRQLVRELARIFRTRIELRQIGVRDEARIVGGLGKCGRPLCCETWLNDFSPVSIRMAKQQDLPLSPMEISGLCGRLLCCLGYEHDYYKDVKSRFPRVGKRIDTPKGQGKVVHVSVLRETVTVLYEDGSELDFTASQLSDDVPCKQATPGDRLSDAQREALDAALQQDDSRAPSGRKGGKGQGSEAHDQQRGDSTRGERADRGRSGSRRERRSRRHPSRRSSDGSPKQAGSRSRKSGAENDVRKKGTDAQGGQADGRQRRPRRSQASRSRRGRRRESGAALSPHGE